MFKFTRENTSRGVGEEEADWKQPLLHLSMLSEPIIATKSWLMGYRISIFSWRARRLKSEKAF